MSEITEDLRGATLLLTPAEMRTTEALLRKFESDRLQETLRQLAELQKKSK